MSSTLLLLSSLRADDYLTVQHPRVAVVLLMVPHMDGIWNLETDLKIMNSLLDVLLELAFSI